MSSPSAERVPVITVSELQTSLRCPRLLWLGRHEGRSTLFDGSLGAGVGARTHTLLSRFESERPMPAELQTELAAGRDNGAGVERALRDLLYHRFLLPDIRNDRERGEVRPATLVRVWQALRCYASALAPVLVENAAAVGPADALARTFVAAELPLRGRFTVAGQAIDLVGRLDSVWADHARGTLLVVDYKTRALGADGEDFLQVAAYRELLRATRGVRARAVLLPLAGRGPQHRYGPQALDRLWRDLHDAHLPEVLRFLATRPEGLATLPGPARAETCGRCPVRAVCHARLGPPPARGATPEVEEPAAEEDTGLDATAAEEGPPRGPRIRLGTRREDGEPVDWFPGDTRRVLHPNTAIVGTMGTGKTECTKSLIAQLRCADGNFGAAPRMLIFDYNGDYAKPAFAEALDARVLRLHRLPFNPLGLPASDAPHLPWTIAKRFVDSLGRCVELGPVQSNRLLDAIMAAYDAAGIREDDPRSWRRKAPTLAGVWRRYLAEEPKKDTLYSVLSDLAHIELFHPDAASAGPVWEALAGVTVIDLVGAAESHQNLAISCILDQFYAEMLTRGHARREGAQRELRCFVVVDEADNFLSHDFPVLRRLLKEARKYGVGVVLSTQYLRHFKTRKERYYESFLTWIVHRIDTLGDRDVKSVLGVHLRADIRALRAAVKACGLFQSVALLADRPGAGRRTVAIDDLPYWKWRERTGAGGDPASSGQASP